MPTIPHSAEVSGDDLLRAVELLSPSDFEQFVARVLAMRAGREVPRLSEPESKLFERINAGLPEKSRQRYEALIARRDARALSEQERAELLELTDQVEALEAARVAALAELAAHRGVTLTALMNELGLPVGDHG